MRFRSLNRISLLSAARHDNKIETFVQWLSGGTGPVVAQKPAMTYDWSIWEYWQCSVAGIIL